MELINKYLTIHSIRQLRKNITNGKDVTIAFDG